MRDACVKAVDACDANARVVVDVMRALLMRGSKLLTRATLVRALLMCVTPTRALKLLMCVLTLCVSTSHVSIPRVLALQASIMRVLMLRVSTVLTHASTVRTLASHTSTAFTRTSTVLALASRFDAHVNSVRVGVARIKTVDAHAVDARMKGADARAVDARVKGADTCDCWCRAVDAMRVVASRASIAREAGIASALYVRSLVCSTPESLPST